MTKLRRTLGIPDGIALLVGITIGAGIYSTPQIIATYTESYASVIGLWLIASAFVLMGGLIYAELGTRFPHTGGEYVYLHRAFGPFVGFLFGWAQLFIIRTSPAAGLAIISANYLEYFVPLNEWQHTSVAITSIVLVGMLNYAGVHRASLFQKYSTAIKVIGMLMLAGAAFALTYDRPGNIAQAAAATATLGPAGNTAAAMMLIVFSFLGWDRVGYVAGEMRDPRRVIPPSLVIGIGIVIAIYVLMNTIYYRVLGIDGLRASEIVASDVATVLFGPVGAALIALLVIVSAVGSTNGTVMSASRVYYAMSRDRLFFRWLDHIHPRFRTPNRAIVVHCAWAIVILLVRGSFENIVSGMVFAILIFYALTTVALMRFRARGDGEDDASLVPLYPWLPLLYLAGIVALLVVRAVFEWQKSLVDLAFVATGIPFAFVWCRRRHL